MLLRHPLLLAALLMLGAAATLAGCLQDADDPPPYSYGQPQADASEQDAGLPDAPPGDDASVPEGAAGNGQEASAEWDAAPEAPVDAAPPTPWVTVTYPEQGATVTNPVTILFSAGGGVTHVSFAADGWALSTAPIDAAAGSFTYDFTGVGYERHLTTTGLDGTGAPVATHEVSFTPVNESSGLVFPIDLNRPGLTLSHFDSPDSTGSFGAARSGGRVHAGCDLYWTDDGGYAYESSYYPFNDNTPIYAVADGTITGYAAFYQGTHALVVDHGSFVVRYGEVDDGGLPGGLGVGSTVTAGQHIANMGDLDMSSGYWSMLHFELFSGQLTGALTNTSNYSYLHVPDANYQRRGDLMDCGPFLRDILEGN